MNVLIDTTIWSLALRKGGRSKEEPIEVAQLTDLIREGRAKLIGPIRQEILSGITQPDTFKLLREKLEAFTDLPIVTEDYERAAEIYNLCRKKGIQGSHIDFLICAVAERYQMAIFTLDKDFQLYATILPLRLFPCDALV